jgi:transcriptional regulator with XRE-family HTH domain
MKRNKPLVIPAKVGSYIRDIRLAKGLSLRRVRRLGGPTQSQMSAIERGKSSFTVETLVQIAAALSVRPAELLPDELFPAFPALPLEAPKAHPKQVPKQVRPQPSPPSQAPIQARDRWQKHRKG